MASVSVQLGLLAIAKDLDRPDLGAIQTASAHAIAAGHRVVDEEIVADTEAAIRGQLNRWIADPEIDVVIVLAGADTESASAALHPLVSKVLPGFTDLFRWLMFQESGASAMLSSAEAAQCSTTFVFVVPGAIAAAMDKLILPQFDPTTTPRNLVAQMPRLNPDAERSTPIPVPIAAEKTQGGSGLPARLPAIPNPRPEPPRAGANVVARPKPNVDPPTRPIELARLERQLAMSNPRAEHDAVTRPTDLAKLLPRLPPGADDTGDDDVTQADALAVPPGPRPIALPSIVARRSGPSGPAPASRTPAAPARPSGPSPAPRREAAKPAAVPPVTISPRKRPSGPSPMTPVARHTATPATPSPVRATPVPSVTPARPIKPAPVLEIVDDADANAPLDDGWSEARANAELLGATAPRSTPAEPPIAAAAPPPPPVHVAPPAPTPPPAPAPPPAAAPPPATLAPTPPTPPRRAPTAPPPPPPSASSDELPRGAFSYPIKRSRSKAFVILPLLVVVLALGAAAVLYIFPNYLARTATKTTPSAPLFAEAPAPIPTTPPIDAAPAEAEIELEADAALPVESTEDVAAPERPTKRRGRKRSRGQKPDRVASATPPADDASADDTNAATATPAPPPPRDTPAPSSDDGCDETGCVLSNYDRPCCAKYRPASKGFQPRVGGVPQALERAMVRAGVEVIKPRIIKCGEKITAKGTVKVAITVTPEGTVSAASLRDSPDPELGACVVAAMRSAKFGKTINGGSVVYPFVF